MQTSSKIKQIKDRLLEFCSIFCFKYDGIDCDIDPFNPTLFHLRCGDQEKDVNSIEDVINDPFFLGKPLKAIADVITDIEW